MSQFSAVMLINANGQPVDQSDQLVVDGVNYCMAELVETSTAKQAFDLIHSMVMGDSLKRKLLFFKAIRYIVCEQTPDEGLLVNSVEFDFIEPSSLLKS